MSGQVVFGWESPTWGGGIAFHDPDAEGRVLGRAYLITVRQFADVLEQEMKREPGADHDLTEVLRRFRHELGQGRYETLHLVGELDDHPVVTFSASDVTELGINAPTAPYLLTIANGLRQAHDLADEDIVDYLLGCPGVDLGWARATLGELLGGRAA
ncbi:MAG: hypothetical protein ACRDOM_07170 [Nocardioides sp.]